MSDVAMINTTLIGIPLDLGARNLGVGNGPDAFREQGILNKLKRAGLSSTDAGNILCRDRDKLDIGNIKLRYAEEIIRVSEETAALTASLLKKNEKVIVLGGDHSINLGVVSGASVALGGDIGLIYLDAHGDMNTEETTLTGNIHGMHLASLLGLGSDSLKAIYGSAPKIARENLLHIGGSDLDKAEVELMEREQLLSFTLLNLLSYGLNPLWKMINDMRSRVSNIWVSLDLDVIDRVYAPGAGMPNPAGLTYREIAAIAEYIGRTSHVVGIDVVEYNPSQDIEHKTAELGIELIAKFLGKNYSWYTNYMESNRVST